MSTHQGNSACPITVDRPTADVWRLEAKKVLMFNHEPFEDYLDYLPSRQLALADIYRDATTPTPSSWPRSTPTAAPPKHSSVPAVGLDPRSVAPTALV
jgi:hypothetical protein